jgi:hypothetical protein
MELESEFQRRQRKVVELWRVCYDGITGCSYSVRVNGSFHYYR